MQCRERIRRRKYLAVAGTAVVAAAITCRAVAHRQENGEHIRPNILWITSEDNGPQIGAYGDPHARTPALDRMASQGVLYTRVSSNAPVCAPARSTLITGMYAPSLGSQHMRSRAILPGAVHLLPEYLRQAGYYCTNNAKEDYNLQTPAGAWDESGRAAHWRNRRPGQPFFSVFNIGVTHESRIWPTDGGETDHDPDRIEIPPYHPDAREVRRDWAQYYDNMTKLDERVAAILAELEEDGLAGDTIVFYFADHGPGMPRGKRWLYEGGLHVPLIVRFPERYRGLAGARPGGVVDDLVSFVDFAPTVLSLAGAPIPKHMQGRPFLGSRAEESRRYTFGYRDRMDERYDMSRSVFDGRYKYIRNYMPHRPQAQYFEYQWRMPTMRVWQRLYDEGELQGAQAAFFAPKAAVELYDTLSDPFEVYNLADSPTHRTVLERLGQAHREWMLTVRDVGLLPEDELRGRARGGAEYDMARDPRRYPVERILDAASLAGSADRGSLERLMALFADEDSAVRYWGAVGCVRLGCDAAPAKEALIGLLDDEAPSVRIAAAEALCELGEEKQALPVLVQALSHRRIEVELQAAIVLDLLDHRALQALGDLARAAQSEERIAGDGSGCVQRVVRKALADVAAAPESAVVLFEGTDFSHWTNVDGGPAGWKIVDDAMQVVPGSGSIMTKERYRDFHLHVEFNVPQSPRTAQGQGRGNSGVYLLRRYEVQILDSFGIQAGRGDCGALYNARAPDRNACRPPGRWQSYDITFRSPRYVGEGTELKKTENARITVLHNGTLIHDDVELANKTGAGRPEGPEPGPILLQDHGHAVRFRNIWIVPVQ